MKHVLVFLCSFFLFSCVTVPTSPKIPEELTFINRRVNAYLTYKPDVWGKDHWQTAPESIMRGTGDCEDYAILKSSLVDDSVYTWRLVIVSYWDIQASKRLYHAILEVEDKNLNVFYLDNRFEYVYTYPNWEYIVLTKLDKGIIEKI